MESEIVSLEGKIDAFREENLKIKTELEGKITSEIARLEGKMQTEIKRLEGKIDTEVTKLEGIIKTRMAHLERKSTVMFVLLLFTMIFLNQNALEFIFQVFGVIK